MANYYYWISVSSLFGDDLVSVDMYIRMLDSSRSTSILIDDIGDNEADVIEKARICLQGSLSSMAPLLLVFLINNYGG
jgi:hypothetical protein